ncbi:MAG TPA: cytochrome P450 [Nitrospira sp.]|nr:cytochrome P450 [Nitrospira sp.]
MAHLVKDHAEDQLMTYKELLHMILLLLAAGTETTVAAIGNTIVCLLRHPEAIAAARKDLSLVSAIVDESIRWQPPLSTTLRFASRDVEIDGVRIQKGQPIQLCLASTNRDERHYDRADEWDPSRHQEGSLSFGAGRHGCPGFLLAHREIEIVVHALLTRFSSFEPADHEIPYIQGRIFRRPRSLILRLRKAS